ncbi:hypothetical protein DL770_009500 [Monosporascus sp. CRB-9-2]|nr:hypothetical protein DL770_009500 [Monosporascus sp. CRB-9-2]
MNGQHINAFTLAMDVLPAVLELAGAPHSHPQPFGGREVIRMCARSWVAHPDGTAGEVQDPDTTITGWELFGLRAKRQGTWKAVYMTAPRGREAWELYEMEADPGEIRDPAEKEPEVLKRLAQHWNVYCGETGTFDPNRVYHVPVDLLEGAPLALGRAEEGEVRRTVARTAAVPRMKPTLAPGAAYGASRRRDDGASAGRIWDNGVQLEENPNPKMTSTATIPIFVPELALAGTQAGHGARRDDLDSASKKLHLPIPAEAGLPLPGAGARARVRPGRFRVHYRGGGRASVVQRAGAPDMAERGPEGAAVGRAIRADGSTNALLIVAFKQGVTISWWRKMMRGGDLNDCHRYWSYADSVWAAATAGRHFNKVGFACLMVALVVIDGPILQRASTVQTVTAEQPGNFSLAIGQDVLGYRTGWYTGRVREVDTLSAEFTRVLAAYNNRDPIVVRAEGCRGSCRGAVVAPGWDVDCTYETRPAAGRPDIAEYLDVGSISVVFGGADQTGSITVSAVFAPRGLEQDMVASTCQMQVGLVRHAVDLSADGIVTLRRRSLLSATNDTVRMVWPFREMAGLGSFPSALGGIAFAASRMFDSTVSLYNGGSLAIEGEGVMAYAYRNSTDDVLGSVSMSWADPTPDVVAAIQELTFRSAASHANATTPLVAALDGSEVLATAVYKSHYDYLGAALAVMMLATLSMVSLLNGWRQLGRDFSLSPVEIAMAFGAPHTAGGDPSADVSTLLKDIGKRRAQYSMLESKFLDSTRDPGSPDLTQYQTLDGEDHP